MREDRLFGPPGTGKTTTLAKWIGRAARDVGSDAIAVGSFTRAAAHEIGSRGLPIPESHVGTVHALAYRALGDGIRIADTPEALREFSDAHPQHALSGAKRADDDLDAPRGRTEADEAYMRLQSLRARLIPRGSGAYNSVLGFASRWEDWKRETGRLDFADLIEVATTDTELPFPGASVGFFDEAQDFTKADLALVRHWSASMDNVILAGDDDQTIYHFRGADPEAFLDPPIPAEREHVLPRSYRVPRSVQRIATAWIETVSRRKAKAYEPRDEEGFVSRLARGSWKDPLGIVEEAEAHAAEGRSVMILATAGYMIQGVAKALRSAGLAYHNPYRPEEYAWNPLTPGRGVSASQRLLAYFRQIEEVWGKDARLWTARELHWIADVLTSKGILAKGAKAALKRASETREGADLELDWETILDYFEEEAAAEGLADPSLDWFDSNLLASKRRGFEFPLQIARMRGVPALREEPRVTIGSIHSVKGGEADVVILVPDLSPSGFAAWTRPGPARDSVVRTFYVGMTRARLGLVLARPVGGRAVPLHRIAGTP